MGNISITQEQALRAEIVAEISAIALCGNVFDRRRKFNSRQDFLSRTQQSIGSGSDVIKEVRFTEVELINIADSDEGFDDCPVPVLTYNVHSFHEFADLRSDNSNSDKDFTEMLLSLRQRFNNKVYFASRVAVSDPGLMSPDGTEFTQFGPDTFTDIVGHFKDLQLKVFYYDSAQG